jgi:hypothetical protein
MLEIKFHIGRGGRMRCPPQRPNRGSAISAIGFERIPPYWIEVSTHASRVMLRTVIQAGVIVALMAGTAVAQVAPLPDNTAPRSKKEKEQAAAEEAYKAATKKIGGPEKKSNDPWGDVRATSAPPAKTKQ